MFSRGTEASTRTSRHQEKDERFVVSRKIRSFYKNQTPQQMKNPTAKRLATLLRGFLGVVD